MGARPCYEQVKDIEGDTIYSLDLQLVWGKNPLEGDLSGDEEKYVKAKLMCKSTRQISLYPTTNTRISKLTCTLKGEVPPKCLLDEDVYVAIDKR